MIVHSVRDFGSAVKAARKREGLTQRELADACRCGVRFISDLENGKPTVEFALAMRIANALGMDLALLRRGEDA